MFAGNSPFFWFKKQKVVGYTLGNVEDIFNLDCMLTFNPSITLNLEVFWSFYIKHALEFYF